MWKVKVPSKIDVEGEELVVHISADQCRDAKEWIFFLIDSLNQSQLVQTIAIWLARRNTIHEEIS
jgi:hypothetical protein